MVVSYGQIEKRLDRIFDGNGNATVLAAFQDRVEKLQRQKNGLAAQAETTLTPGQPLKEAVKPLKSLFLMRLL